MEDLTFVVQGPIAPSTEKNLQSIRDFYPKSQIILSTWANQPIEGLEFDDILFNTDPGPVKTYENHGINANRLIVSTRNGLKAVKTSRAIKTRTDIGFSRPCPQFFSLMDGSYFHKKIVGLDLFFRNPLKSNKLFHIGDLFMAGLTQDLQNLWDIPLVVDFEIYPTLRERVFNRYPVRVTTEQYLWLTFMRKQHSDAYIDYVEDVDIRRFVQSESSLVSNFEIRTAQELGLVIPIRLLDNGGVDSVYSQSDFDRITSRGSDISTAKKIFGRRDLKALFRFLREPRRWI